MPVNVIPEKDVLAAALPNSDVNPVGNGSNGTAQLYDEVSDDEFSDANSGFVDEVARLKREYFDVLHMDDVPDNFAYNEYPAATNRSQPISDFEKQHYHRENVTPDRLCSAFFKNDTFMPASEILDALEADGFRAEHVRCLQQKPTCEVFLTFRNPSLRDAFLKKSSFVASKRPGRRFIPNNAERTLTFLTIYDAPYEFPDLAIVQTFAVL